MLKILGLLIWKDLRNEMRRKEQLGSIFLFTMLATLVLNFALPPSREVQWLVPGLLWVIFVFAGTLGINKAFAMEKENGCLQGLTLIVSPGLVFLAKALATLVMLLIVELIAFPLIMLLFSFQPQGSIVLFALVAVLATLGFASIGIFMAALASFTKNSELLFPVLLFPLLMPLIIGAVETSVAILNGQPTSQWLGYAKLIVAFDLIYMVVPWFLFDHLVEV